MNMPSALNTDTTMLLLIDFQERLFPVMHEKEKLLRNVVKLIRGAKALEIPIILTEQYPKGIGRMPRRGTAARPTAACSTG